VLHLTRPVNDKTKGFKSVVTVDEIRKINRFLSMTAHDGAYRIAIVDPADDMNTNAANALLKNLEEPPPRTLFILIAHSLGSLLPTIRSRCQTIKFKPLEPAALLQVLDASQTTVPDDEAGRAALAARAGGSVRDALLLTEYGGLDIADAVSGVLRSRPYAYGDAWRVAEAVSGRDAAVQFSIFNQHALEAIAEQARGAALAGDSARADGLAELWREAEQAIAETETYNLDKKQHVSGMLQRMWRARRVSVNRDSHCPCDALSDRQKPIAGPPMPSQTYYITTAISYPNGVPHIGHAYELIATDAIARFQRLDGKRRLLPDRHRRARHQDVADGAQGRHSPRELADRNAAEFKRDGRSAGPASNDDFIRTTEARHYEASQAIWKAMAAAGDIYKGGYAGWYSVRDEAYYDEDETKCATMACVTARRARRRVGGGGELFLPPVGL
jgi:DNA polymerase-3 subunit delta'